MVPEANTVNTYIVHTCIYIHAHVQSHFSNVYKDTLARVHMGLTGTHCSCISWVRAGTSKVVGVLATFCQVMLCPCTIHMGIPGWTTSSSKSSISRSFNCSWVAQLTAHDYSINKVPVVITNSAPMAKEKDLNTTFQQSITSNQSNRPFCSCVIWRNIYSSIRKHKHSQTDDRFKDMVATHDSCWFHTL